MNAYTNPIDQQQTPEPAPLPPPVAPAAVPPGVRRPSPGLAVVLSFFTGLGHLYLGLYQRGLAFFITFAIAILLADRADFGILVPFVWFFGLIDAYRQAQRINAGLLPDSLLEPGPKRRPVHSTLGFGVFLTVVGLLLLYNQFYPLDLSFLYDWWPLILVGFGVYLVSQHVIETKRRQEAEQDRTALE